MPDASDRQQAQESRAAFLRDEGAPDPGREPVNPDAGGPLPTFDEAAISRELREEAERREAPSEVQVSAVFVPGGIEVRILIPHDGIAVELPDLPNTLAAHTDDAASGAEDPIN